MTTLAREIIQQNHHNIERLIQMGADVNEIDEYGYTPLSEAAIVDDIEAMKILLARGADVNKDDMIGGSTLAWAVENSNMEMIELLLKHGANPNAYNNSGEPVLAKAILRKNKDIQDLLRKNGAKLTFPQDYINAKFLGHSFDLQGEIDIIDAEGKFTEVSLEGFYLEFSIGLILNSLVEFQNNYAAKHLRGYFNDLLTIIQAMDTADKLVKYQQYQVDVEKYRGHINNLLDGRPLILPIGSEGHASAIIIYKDILVKCDRRKDDQLINGITFFEIRDKSALDYAFLKYLLYQKKPQKALDKDLNKTLKLKFKARMLIEPQMTGNCSWANLESCLPALLFLLRDDLNNYPEGIIDFNHDAIQFYRKWRDWNRNRALHFEFQEFNSTNKIKSKKSRPEMTKSDKARQASKASLLAAILFQRCDARRKADVELAARILPILKTPGLEYILKNWLEFYANRKKTKAGENLKMLIELAGDLS